MCCFCQLELCQYWIKLVSIFTDDYRLMGIICSSITRKVLLVIRARYSCEDYQNRYRRGLAPDLRKTPTKNDDSSGWDNGDEPTLQALLKAVFEGFLTLRGLMTSNECLRRSNARLHGNGSQTTWMWCTASPYGKILPEGGVIFRALPKVIPDLKSHQTDGISSYLGSLQKWSDR